MTLKILTNRLLHSEPGTVGSPPAAAPEPSAPTEGSVPEIPETDFEAFSVEMEKDDDVIVDELPLPTEGEPTDPPAPSGEPEPAPAPTPPAQPPSAPPVPAAPTATPAAPAPEPVVPPAAPSAEPPPAAPAPASEPLTPETIAAAYQRYEATILPQLEQQYQLTPAQVDELNENPGQAVPKLLARVHYSAQVAAYTGVMSQVPRVVQAIVERHRMIEKAEGTFYGRWPALANASHSKAVENVLNTWRAANPNATTEEMVEKAGLMAMLSLGLDPTPQASIPPPGNPTPPTPPARPAGTGGSGPTRGATNVWDEMAESIIAEGT